MPRTTYGFPVQWTCICVHIDLTIYKMFSTDCKGTHLYLHTFLMSPQLSSVNFEKDYIKYCVLWWCSLLTRVYPNTSYHSVIYSTDQCTFLLKQTASYFVTHGSSVHAVWYMHRNRGATSSSFRGAIFTKFHSMTSSCLFNRGTTFSQTVTYNNNEFLPTDTKSIVQRHTFRTTLLNKNRQNRTFYNSVGGWITGVKRNFWLHAMCACTQQHSTYQIRWDNWWLGLRIWCLPKCVVLGFMLQYE